MMPWKTTTAKRITDTGQISIWKAHKSLHFCWAKQPKSKPNIELWFCIDTRFVIILVLLITFKKINKHGHLKLSSSTNLEIVLKFINREMGISTWSSSSSSPSLEWSSSMSDRSCFSKLMVYETSNFKISSEDSLALSLCGNVDSAN